MAAAEESQKPIVFRSLKFSKSENDTIMLSSDGTREMMTNLNGMVDVSKCKASNPKDNFAKLVGPGRELDLNKTVWSALKAAAESANFDLKALDAFVLGEPELLANVPEGEVRCRCLSKPVVF